MNIQLFRYCASLLLVLGTLIVPTWADTPIGVTVNGKNVALDQAPVAMNGRVLVPLRGIFESLGAAVSYNASTRGVDAKLGSTDLHLTIDSQTALVNGQPTTLEVPAQTIGGRTMVPLRFVSETLGARVAWDAASRTVSVLSASAPSVAIEPPQPPPPPIMIVPPMPERPAIQSVVLNGAGPLHSGEVLNVVMIGTPHCTGTLEIQGMAAAIPMTETAPGHYEANYTVEPLKTPTAALNVIGHLSNQGLEASMQAPTALSLAPPEGNMFVHVTTPKQDEKVQSDFVVTGTTLPFATVDIKCSHNVNASGQADATGHFAVPVHMGFHSGEHTVNMQVTATDTNGRLSKKQEYHIAVGQD